MEIFNLEGVCAGYKDRPVLDNVTFGIGEGEFVAIIGPNGSGKSTLVKVLAGAITPGSGSVGFRGRPLGDYGWKEIARSFSVVHQFGPDPLPFTVRDFVAMGRFPHRGLFPAIDPRGVRAAEDENAVDRALSLAGIADLGGRRITELSGGERQLAAIACALAQNDRIILLDEPVASLDIRHTMMIMDVLYDLNRSGSTVIVVLHDINLAACYCRRMLGLQNGKLFLDESTEDAVTYERIEALYDTLCVTGTDPVTSKPHVYPVPGFVRKK
jgi:iron complex transport system ATP-binding protein